MQVYWIDTVLGIRYEQPGLCYRKSKTVSSYCQDLMHLGPTISNEFLYNHDVVLYMPKSISLELTERTKTNAMPKRTCLQVTSVHFLP